tara:strand:+ start:4812 stop:5048 length:237 start_codon:yes stop_codon:yes gene_type:complete
MKLPIELPNHWTAEPDAYGIIITGTTAAGDKVFVTVNESMRSFGLGIVSINDRQNYTGRNWRRQLYSDAVEKLKETLR